MRWALIFSPFSPLSSQLTHSEHAQTLPGMDNERTCFSVSTAFTAGR